MTVIDQLRKMVTGYARQRPPWRSSSSVIDKVHPSSLIRTATISRASAVVQQAPSSITSSAAHIVIRHRGHSSFDGDRHGAHPSRRRCCAVTTAACAETELLCRVLFPALREAGDGKQNAVVVMVVRRYAGLVVVAILRSLSSPIVNVLAYALNP